MTGSRRFVVAASAALAAVLAAPALAAYICHPDPPGTRTLTLGGTVLRYTLDGARVSVAVRSGGACRVVAWNALTGVRLTAAVIGTLSGTLTLLVIVARMIGTWKS